MPKLEVGVDCRDTKRGNIVRAIRIELFAEKGAGLQYLYRILSNVGGDGGIGQLLDSLAPRLLPGRGRTREGFPPARIAASCLDLFAVILDVHVVTTWSSNGTSS